MTDIEEFACECKSIHCMGIIEGSKKEKMINVEAQAS